jgi:CelD/BcsL family acetyltransferase involved in cellulose biosynthesis
VHHDTFYYYQPSFDLNWSEYSPGNVLLAKVIGWCIDNGIPTLDFMMGDHGYKNAYANQKLELTDFLFPASLTGRFADWALRNLYFRSRDRPHEPGEHEVGERLEATGH